MLDNLKIGYGGTKEEMERLLDDASKLQSEKLGTDVKFDIARPLQVTSSSDGITAGYTRIFALDKLTFAASLGSKYVREV